MMLERLRNDWLDPALWAFTPIGVAFVGANILWGFPPVVGVVGGMTIFAVGMGLAWAHIRRGRPVPPV